MKRGTRSGTGKKTRHGACRGTCTATRLDWNRGTKHGAFYAYSFSILFLKSCAANSPWMRSLSDIKRLSNGTRTFQFCKSFSRKLKPSDHWFVIIQFSSSYEHLLYHFPRHMDVCFDQIQKYSSLGSTFFLKWVPIFLYLFNK